MLDIGILEHIDKLTRFFAQSLNAFARVDFDYDIEAKEIFKIALLVHFFDTHEEIILNES